MISKLSLAGLAAVAMVGISFVLLGHRHNINKPNQQAQTTQQSSQLTSATTSTSTTTPANHQSITTTVFWIGENTSSDNGGIANVMSAWDENWQAHYGGIDDPVSRQGYLPKTFTPGENPFYFALPYNDLNSAGNRKSTAKSCPNATNSAQLHYSWCKNSWIAIQFKGKTVYAQWEDVGPYQEDDYAYVFGASAPKNKIDVKAGLDVSPAVRDYLGLGDVSKTSWSFVSVSDVPAGPWKQIVTTTLGDQVD